MEKTINLLKIVRMVVSITMKIDKAIIHQPKCLQKLHLTTILRKNKKVHQIFQGNLKAIILNILLHISQNKEWSKEKY